MHTGPVLTLDDLHKSFDLGFLGSMPFIGSAFGGLGIKGIGHRVDALRGLSLAVEPGEIFGFLGPNGAGKTTTIKMLMGLIRPTRGSGTLLGRPLGDRVARNRLGYLPEQPYFYEHLAPLEFLDFYGGLFPMTAGERRKRALALIDRVGLTHAINRPIRKFSKGMVQRIGIAQALINDPELVVLDEPMSGLDPLGRKEVRDLIYELRTKGKTVFFSSHILQDVEQISDRVAIIVKGKLHRIGPVAELLESPTAGVEVVLRAVSEAALPSLSALATAAVSLQGEWRYHLAASDSVDGFIRCALELGASVVSVIPHRRSLEEIFVEEASRA